MLTIKHQQPTKHHPSITAKTKNAQKRISTHNNNNQKKMEKLKNQSPKFQTQAQILHIHFLEKVKKGKLPEVARENFRFPVKQHRLDLRVLKAASKSYNFSLIFPIKQKKKKQKNFPLFSHRHENRRLLRAVDLIDSESYLNISGRFIEMEVTSFSLEITQMPFHSFLPSTTTPFLSDHFALGLQLPFPPFLS